MVKTKVTPRHARQTRVTDQPKSKNLASSRKDAEPPGSGSKSKTTDAVKFFTDASSSTKVRGNVALSLALTTLEETSRSSGLSAQHILQLVQVAASARFPASVNCRLMKCLLPEIEIPEEAVLSAVSWMCTNKPTSELQALLLKWMILTYDLIESRTRFHALYGVIFQFIENDTLSPHVCHLLYLLTRKEDVVGFRVRRLLDLQKRVGIQSHITALLSIYKLYRPHLVSLAVPSTQRVYFRQLEKAWSAQVRTTKERITTAGKMDDSLYERLHGSMTEKGPVTKKQKLEIVPRVTVTSILRETEEASSRLAGGSINRVQLQDISSFEDLVDNMDRLELPSQVSAVLRSPYLQHAVSCHKQQHVLQRLSFWLYQTLSEEFSENGENQRGQELIQMLINFTDFLQNITEGTTLLQCHQVPVIYDTPNFMCTFLEMSNDKATTVLHAFLVESQEFLISDCQHDTDGKEDVPVCENWLVKYLHTWNGLDYRPYILRIVSRFRIHHFQKLNDLILEPLRNLFFCSSLYFKCQLVYCFTELLRNCVVLELPRYRDTVAKAQGGAAMQTGDGDIAITGHSLFESYLDQFEALQTIQNFIEIMDRIFAIALQLERDNALLMHHVLTFYELVSHIHTKYSVPFTCLPSPGVVYRAIFSSNAMICSRMCSIIARYRGEYSSLKKSTEASNNMSDLSNQVTLLNGYILDVSNALWRSKAFTTFPNSRTPSVFNMKPEIVEATEVEHPSISFSLHHHIALVGYAWKFLTETQPEGKRVHPSLIRGDIRDTYLEFLKTERVDGVVNFISTFIKRSSSTR